MTTLQKLLLIAALGAASACSRPESAAEPASSADASAAPAVEPGTAAISPQVAERAGIETAEAAPAEIRTEVALFGSVRTEPENVVEVTARYPGVIQSVLRQIGDRVRAGELLAKVESNESLQVYWVSSPIAGVVTQRHANPGEVAGSAALFEVVDASKVRVDLDAFPQDRAKLEVGQKVRVASTDAGTTAEGRLTYISPLGSAATQSVTARVSLDNPQGRWAPGQFVTADVLLDDSPAAVTVAPTALQQVKGRTVVFVEAPEGFTVRRVELGRRSAAAVEIKAGLEAGERYAAKNTFLLKAELLKSQAED